MKLRILRAAEADIDHAIDYYRDIAGPGVAAEFYREFRRVARTVQERPGLGHAVGRSVRAFGLRRFPFDLVYRADADAVTIVAVAHHRREPAYWRRR
ncbi:Plasmid stabilization system protein [Azoarcus sp. Aa7]|nr:Plasmid stabilization system protein [Azoarcus sp. Aa7]